jgi:methionyl-tRNA formyltransferase
MDSPIRLVFMGSPDFAVPALETLFHHSMGGAPYTVVGVVTQPDRPAGRARTLFPPPVKAAAERLDLPILQPEKIRTPESMDQLRAWSPDVIVVVAFGQILRPDLLALPRFGCINVHGSLLPRWRGAAPIQAAILSGDDQTGITIMKMDAGIDTGPMLSQRSIPIDPQDTGGTLFVKMAPLGADLLVETLPRYLSGEVQPVPQPEEGVTYAKMLKKEDGLLDFSQPAAALERQVLAFSPWPGTYLLYGEGQLKVHHSIVVAGKCSPGEHTVFQGLPAVGTSDGLLVLDMVQPSGRKVMSGKDFLFGARDWV